MRPLCVHWCFYTVHCTRITENTQNIRNRAARWPALLRTHPRRPNAEARRTQCLQNWQSRCVNDPTEAPGMTLRDTDRQTNRARPPRGCAGRGLGLPSHPQTDERDERLVDAQGATWACNHARRLTSATSARRERTSQKTIANRSDQ